MRHCWRIAGTISPSLGVVSFEYILLGELNDSPQQAAELAERVGGFSHVNLIAYNPIDEEDF